MTKLGIVRKLLERLGVSPAVGVGTFKPRNVLDIYIIHSAAGYRECHCGLSEVHSLSQRDAERRLREMGRRRDVKFISCKGLVAGQVLMEQMRRMLHTIQAEYQYPVDTEFTINISDNGEYSIDLLQCRPLQIPDTGTGTAVPEYIPEEQILLESKGASMGLTGPESLDLIVYVDAVGYYNMPYNQKHDAAQLIGQINWKYRNQNKKMLLIVPGRVGTSSPELGVPTAFSDISAFSVICETEETQAGYNPELSYGSHIFQDLVEADILYTAVFRNEKTLHFAPELLQKVPDITSNFDGGASLAGIVNVYDVSGMKCRVYHDITEEHLMITFA